MNRTAQITYVVIPHPDDEFSAWGLLRNRPTDYRVFILLTHGETCGACDGSRIRPDLGERIPQPQPFLGPGSNHCGAQRLDSWHAFLDGMAGIDPSLGEVSPRVDTFDRGSGPFALRVGERSARVVFDGGDASLTPEFVIDAIQRTRDLRQRRLPVDAEDRIIGAAYLQHNGSRPHPAHQAVHEVLWKHEFGLPGGQWCRTSADDPRIAESGGIFAVPQDMYDKVMGVADDGRRTGLFQKVYGWLGFNGPDNRWASGDTDREAAPFNRLQPFWRRFENMAKGAG